jgi:protein-S-isoprenylcysteine O-methyltransferase Ste14
MGTIYILIASIIWGLVHSWLASHRFKNFVRKSAGSLAYSRFYRFSYNLFAFASLIPVVLLLMVVPDKPLYAIPSPWIYLTTIIQGLAAFALIAGVVQTGVWDFVGLSQLSADYQESTPARLVVDGLYRYVRHPLYTAGLVFIWLTPEMTFNRLVLWLVFSIYILIGAYFEERKLLVDFGQVYLDYQARTPMIIPKLRFTK